MKGNKKWTHKMYKAYYGMGRRALAKIVKKELNGIKNEESKLCLVWKKKEAFLKVLLRK
jgi:hypothetical protein